MRVTAEIIEVHPYPPIWNGKMLCLKCPDREVWQTTDADVVVGQTVEVDLDTTEIYSLSGWNITRTPTPVIVTGAVYPKTDEWSLLHQDVTITGIGYSKP